MTLADHTNIWAIILAAGKGERLASATGNIPKQFINYNGVPLYWHSVRVFAKVPSVDGLVIVFPEAEVEKQQQTIQQILSRENIGIPLLAAQGGQLRQDSVRNGLKALPGNADHVLVHDAARPFLTATLVYNLCHALAKGAKAVIPAIPVTDTIKRCNGKQVIQTLPRNELVAVQTPQGFDRALLAKAHEQGEKQGLTVTDDASLIESLGETVEWIQGEMTNRKITQPEDLCSLQMSHTSTTRVGMGYDVHRYADEGRPMKLGGVPIDNAPQILAHSDGDVLIHALMDALLGCACLGDIGQHFPDSDKRYDNISSAILLDEVLARIHEKNLTVCHIDATIIAQKPRLSVWREAIRANIARLLSLDKNLVNIKATTEEGLGFTGRLEGIKACVVATCEAKQ